jgi:hypothetical protein
MMGSVRRPVLVGLVALCAVGGLGSMSAPASAGVGHRYLSQLTEVPAEPGVAVSGPFTEPVGLASVGGDVYVEDAGGLAVDEFNSTGDFVSQISSGSFEEMNPGVAADRATGEVYVPANIYELYVFSAAGVQLGDYRSVPGTIFEGPEYLAMDNSADPSDPAAGDLYVASKYENLVNVLRPAAGGMLSYVTRLTGTPSGGRFAHLAGVAVDEANGDLLVAEEGESEDEHRVAVDVFKPKASSSPEVPEYEFLFALRGPPGGVFYELGAVAADGSDGDFYVAARQLSANANGEITVDVDQFSSSGAFLAQVEGTPSGPFEEQAPRGLAIGSSGDIYVAQPGAKVVDVFSTFTTPDVSTLAPSSPHSTSLTLNGTVDPNGVPVTACEFEYGAGTSYGSSVPCSPAPGSAAGVVAVTGSPTGLAPDSVYHYRLAATGAEDVTVYTRDETAATPPAVGGSALASGITSFAATLSGVLLSGEVTPEYHFAYGLTSAYGSNLPEPNALGSAGGEQPVTQVVTGLRPDTTYHYALVGTNFGGGVSVGPDETFTTRPLVPPAVSTGGAQEVVGTSAALTGALDPEGLPTAYRFEYGTSTAYGSSWPDIQAFAGSGSTSEVVAVTVPNLQPGVTYHYRLVASNEDGTSYGVDETFATPGYPVSVVQEPPVLSASLGFLNPEGGRSAGKPSKSKGGKGKGKGKGKKRKRRKRGEHSKAKGGRKG